MNLYNTINYNQEEDREKFQMRMSRQMTEISRLHCRKTQYQSMPGKMVEDDGDHTQSREITDSACQNYSLEDLPYGKMPFKTLEPPEPNKKKKHGTKDDIIFKNQPQQ